MAEDETVSMSFLLGELNIGASRIHAEILARRLIPVSIDVDFDQIQFPKKQARNLFLSEFFVYDATRRTSAEAEVVKSHDRKADFAAAAAAGFLSAASVEGIKWILESNYGRGEDKNGERQKKISDRKTVMRFRVLQRDLDDLSMWAAEAHARRGDFISTSIQDEARQGSVVLYNEMLLLMEHEMMERTPRENRLRLTFIEISPKINFTMDIIRFQAMVGSNVEISTTLECLLRMFMYRRRRAILNHA